MAAKPEDRHPVPDLPYPEGKPVEEVLRELWQYVRVVAIRTGQLWDHDWWMSLSPEKRAEYEAQGFRDPIEKWYGEGA